jgi:hypothetical protein
MSNSDETKRSGQAQVGYLPPYSVLKPAFSFRQADGQSRVEMPLELFGRIFELALRQIGFDEIDYLEKNPDVAMAVSKGQIKSAIGHFARSGYFEHRPISPVAADPAWYLKEYPDVARSVEHGKTRSASDHWRENGYREGRAPSSQLAGEVASWRSFIQSKT